MCCLSAVAELLLLFNYGCNFSDYQIPSRTKGQGASGPEEKGIGTGGLEPRGTGRREWD